ncbi:MAG TPA: hypothetical protein ENF78_04530, partial [Candidatus Bathyarchaeota archaeon]|nr:hypothetical protein [Candidatus Bathyarchaeota archaeon]
MATQMEMARRGQATEEMEAVAKLEGVPLHILMRRVASGRVVITRNVRREHVRPTGIGEGLRVKVNANVGTSPDLCDPDL